MALADLLFLSFTSISSLPTPSLPSLLQELEDNALDWLAEEKGVEVDDLEVLFNVEQALGMSSSELKSYVKEICESCKMGDRAGKFVEKFGGELEALRNWDSDKN